MPPFCFVFLLIIPFSDTSKLFLVINRIKAAFIDRTVMLPFLGAPGFFYARRAHARTAKNTIIRIRSIAIIMVKTSVIILLVVPPYSVRYCLRFHVHLIRNVLHLPASIFQCHNFSYVNFLFLLVGVPPLSIIYAV